MTTCAIPVEKTSKQAAAPAAELDRLAPIFSPKSIAVIGASNREGSVGNAIFKNILMGGYCGTLYPVNPKAPSICGVHSYTSISAIPQEIDLALIIVPANVVPEVLEECGQKGVRGAVIVTAGFKEIGPEGAALEQRIIAIGQRYHMPLVGPNCLGVINTDRRHHAQRQFRPRACPNTATSLSCPKAARSARASWTTPGAATSVFRNSSASATRPTSTEHGLAALSGRPTTHRRDLDVPGNAGRRPGLH